MKTGLFATASMGYANDIGQSAQKDRRMNTAKLRELLEVATVRSGDDAELAQAAYDADEELTDTMHEWLPALLDEIDRRREALKPFADCCDQIDAAESDEEWAKFRLLVKDYRRARAALGDKS